MLIILIEDETMDAVIAFYTGASQSLCKPPN